MIDGGHVMGGGRRSADAVTEGRREVWFFDSTVQGTVGISIVCGVECVWGTDEYCESIPLDIERD